MASDDRGQPRLTRNQELVLGALSSADGALSAYAILDRLRGDGLRAPLQVYRALEKLVESGQAHRLESINAFVACRHSGCDAHRVVAFAICDDCGHVAEVADPALERDLGRLADKVSFQRTSATVEMRGVCAGCRGA